MYLAVVSVCTTLQCFSNPSKINNLLATELTFSPFSNNVNKSMDLVTNGVLKTEGEEFYTKFSYLKINNSIETVINVTLLNDLLRSSTLDLKTS